MNKNDQSSKKLIGKIAVITGGASGIGKAYAERLAKDGATIAIADIKDVAEVKAAVDATGQKFFAIKTDVTNPEQVKAFADGVKSNFGGADILVNNVGIYPLIKFEEVTFEIWRNVLSTNVDSALLFSKEFLPGMKQKGWGRIVNMTSTAFWQNTEEFTPYVTSKGAVVGFTRGLSSEVGKYGITVNAIAPSMVKNETTENSISADLFDSVAKAQAIKRTELPEDLVGTLSFLVSDDAAFITGQTIAVDGGAIKH